MWGEWEDMGKRGGGGVEGIVGALPNECRFTSSDTKFMSLTCDVTWIDIKEGTQRSSYQSLSLRVHTSRFLLDFVHPSPPRLHNLLSAPPEKCNIFWPRGVRWCRRRGVGEQAWMVRGWGERETEVKTFHRRRTDHQKPAKIWTQYRWLPIWNWNKSIWL